MSQVACPPAAPIFVGTLHWECVDLLRDAHVSEMLDRSLTLHAGHVLLHQLLHAAMAVVTATALGLVGVAQEHHANWADELAGRFRDKRAVESVVFHVVVTV